MSRFSWVSEVNFGSKAHLTIVERSFNSDIVNVCIGDCGHLGLLDRGDTALRVEDENRNVLLVSKAIDCRAERVFRKEVTVVQPSAYLPVSPLVAPSTVSLSFTSPLAFFAFLLAKKNSNRFPSS